MADPNFPRENTTASHSDCSSSPFISKAALKRCLSTFCGSEPWAGPADCAAYYASSLTSLANRECDAVREAIRLQRYKTPSRVLPDHTIIQRPDCVVPIQLADCSLHYDRPPKTR